MTVPSAKEDIQLLVIGDVHAELNALGCIVASAKASGEAYDVALCTGDLGSDVWHAAHGADHKLAKRLREVSIPPILETLAVLDIPVLFVPGNHDHANTRGCGDVRSVDVLGENDPVEICGWRIAGIGGSPRTPAQLPYEWEDDKLLEHYGQMVVATAPEIMLLHSPPRGERCDVGGPTHEHLGSTALRRVIERCSPRLAVCGHIHEAVGWEVIGSTLLMNAGKIHDERIFYLSNGCGIMAKVHSYFSIVLSVDGRMTLAHFMHAPGLEIAPVAASFDGHQLLSRTLPRETARNAWAMCSAEAD